MRTFLISALLASVVATPLQAAPGDRERARSDRQQAREDRDEARLERQQAREPRAERVDRSIELRASGNERPARAEGGANRYDGRGIRESRDKQRLERGEDRRQAREQRIETNRANRELRRSDRDAPAVFRPRVPVVSEAPRVGTQPPLRTETRRYAPVNWSQHWRNDRRYDWRNWRNRHRSLFRLGFYYDPFGWGYQRHSIGWRLWPSYYGSNYWLNDPWQYRLPYAPPGYRWIRYYDDAILVDMWSGQVVDVIYSFFW